MVIILILDTMLQIKKLIFLNSSDVGSAISDEYFRSTRVRLKPNVIVVACCDAVILGVKF